MNERPILFSAPMVRAILDGSKTQTRRVCKPAQKSFLTHVVDCLKGLWGDEEGNVQFKCPHGQPGDRLWVRETFCQFPEDAKDGNGAQTYYKAAQHPDDMGTVEGIMKKNGVRWKPSIHMPRSASRILLEIVSVRVERLQDISEDDAIAEGIERMPCDVPDTKMWKNYNPGNGWMPSVAIPQNSFRSLWESINGEENWLFNPWVWIVEFKQVMP